MMDLTNADQQPQESTEATADLSEHDVDVVECALNFMYTGCYYQPDEFLRSPDSYFDELVSSTEPSSPSSSTEPP
jgi:hypothetical protein